LPRLGGSRRSQARGTASPDRPGAGIAVLAAWAGAAMLGALWLIDREV
jgi:hypothetical protein